MIKASVTKPQANPSYTGIPGIANKIGGKLTLPKGKARPKPAKASPAGRIPKASDGKLSYA
jgi:hypothetical protein